MKKFLDKYLFSRSGAQLLASVGVILLFALLVPSCRRVATGAEYKGVFQFLGWGLKQVSSPAGAVGTLEGLDGVLNPASRVLMLLMAVACWVVSIGVFSFITGSIVNWFRNRKHLIDSGLVRYKFKDHGLVVGWDFQGASCVRELLKSCPEVLVVSAVPAKQIRSELKRNIRSRELGRVYVYNGLVTVGRGTLINAYPELSRQIVILGEHAGQDSDGGNLNIERVLRAHIERANLKRDPIKIYLHIEDSVLYTQAIAMPKEGFSENDGLIDLEIFNYYESWAWRCLSLQGARDKDLDCDQDGVIDKHDGDEYLPLRHIKDAERVELFVVGSSPMGRAFVNYAMPLMNYGVDAKHCKITIFDAAEDGGVFLPERSAIEAMPEVDVEFKQMSGGTDAANDIMLAAASDPKTAVTIVIATPGPDEAVKSYAQLANSLRRMNVSILVWQATATDQCPRKAFLQTCGDCAKLRYFGMTDRLPWKNPERQKNGCRVNFFYEWMFNWDEKKKCWHHENLKDVEMPGAFDADLIPMSEKAWAASKEEAERLWLALPRWKKCSSISSGDSLKEKAFAFGDCATNMETRRRLLHAEHNRWWTERLLAGWKLCPKPNDPDKTERKRHQEELKAKYCHWDMIPFDQLDDFTKDIDKVCIATMALQGEVGSK